MTIPAPDLADDDESFEEPEREAETAWIEAEAFIIDRISGLSRWDAERWTAAHEREVPPVSMRALRASVMQAAINARKSDVLEAAFERIEHAVATSAWATPTGDAHAHADANSNADGDRAFEEAVEEAAEGVTGIAQHAMAAVVLAEELEAGGLSEQRQEQLALAKEKVYADLISSC